jgi:hypothetical protein
MEVLIRLYNKFNIFSVCYHIKQKWSYGFPHALGLGWPVIKLRLHDICDSQLGDTDGLSKRETYNQPQLALHGERSMCRFLRTDRL